MRRLLPLALAALFAAPTHAVLMLASDVSGTTFNCIDNAACDTNPAVGNITLANATTINGVMVNGSITTSAGTLNNPGPQNRLNTSSLSVINNSGASRTAVVTVSDTNFTPVATQFALSGSGTWENANGATILLRWWDDPNNTQGATAFNVTPGALIGSFADTAVGIADAFAFSNSGNLAVSDTGPFSMTEQFMFTLPAGGTLLGRSQTEIKPFSPIPEPGTLLLMGAAVAFMAWKRRT